MNLRSRIGGLLQGRQSSGEPTAPDSEAVAREERHRQDEAQKLHMRRLNMVRNRELDDLRAIMLRRGQKRTGSAMGTPQKPTGSTGVTRPPGLVEGSKMVSLINELEIKVLSEPMGLTIPRTAFPALPVSTEPSGQFNSSGPGSSPTNPLDDAALMMAARRWGQAGEVLLNGMGERDMKEVDWVARCAIDLLDRGGHIQRASDARHRYIESNGHAPARIVPPKLAGTIAGSVRACGNSYWPCPIQLESKDVLHLQATLRTNKSGTPVVIDWSELTFFDARAVEPMQHVVQMAMRSRTVFIQVGLPRLIRVARQELQAQTISEVWWSFWLTLMNWNGFRHAHRAAAIAFSRRFQCDVPAYTNIRCLSHPLNKPVSGPGSEIVTAIRLFGDLCREHARELEVLETPLAQPGGMVLLDCRFLTSVDFFFGTDLLNWVIRHHTRGLVVSLAFAHPLLAHFLQMMGLQDYAKLHRLPPPYKP